MYTPNMQFIKDWMLALVVLIMVIVDLVVLIIFTTVVGVGNLTLVEVIPHKENPQSEQGVRAVTLSQGGPTCTNHLQHYYLSCCWTCSD